MQTSLGQGQVQAGQGQGQGQVSCAVGPVQEPSPWQGQDQALMKLGLVLEPALLGQVQARAALEQGQGQMLVALEQQPAQSLGRGQQGLCLPEGAWAEGWPLAGFLSHQLLWC